MTDKLVIYISKVEVIGNPKGERGAVKSQSFQRKVESSIEISTVVGGLNKKYTGIET